MDEQKLKELEGRIDSCNAHISRIASNIHTLSDKLQTLHNQVNTVHSERIDRLYLLSKNQDEYIKIIKIVVATALLVLTLCKIMMK